MLGFSVIEIGVRMRVREISVRKRVERLVLGRG